MADSSEVVANVSQRRVSELLIQDKRLDGRGLTDYREIRIEIGPVEKAEGSAQVSIGNTKVMVGVKVETGSPFPDTPEEGVLTVNAELVPLAAPTFEPGPPSEDAVELARVVDRGIRESKAIDLPKLCLVPRKQVQVVFVDIYVLDHDGNLFDASALASLSALMNARIPVYTTKNGGEMERTGSYAPLPLKNHPITVTMAKIDGKLIVDPSFEEEQMVDARISVAVTDENRICAIQKGGIGTLTAEEVSEAIKIAVAKSQEIRKTLLGGKNPVAPTR